jgi:hypothetical protein
MDYFIIHAIEASAFISYSDLLGLMPMSTTSAVTPLDILTLVIAAWGALIATILGVREILKDRRSLKITLESIHWMEAYRILLVNTGKRLITITEINLHILKDKHLGVGEVPKSAYWATEEGYEPPKLPLTLKDGEMAIFYIAEELGWEISKGGHLKIKVFDAEGHTYSQYNEGEYDPKYGYRTPKYKQPNIFSRIRWKIQSFFRNR